VGDPDTKPLELCLVPLTQHALFTPFRAREEGRRRREEAGKIGDMRSLVSSKGLANMIDMWTSLKPSVYCYFGSDSLGRPRHQWGVEFSLMSSFTLGVKIMATHGFDGGLMDLKMASLPNSKTHEFLFAGILIGDDPPSTPATTPASPWSAPASSRASPSSGGPSSGASSFSPCESARASPMPGRSDSTRFRFLEFFVLANEHGQCAVQGVTRKEFDHDGIHFFAMNGVDKPILHSVFAARKCEPPPKLVELFEISEGQADYVDLFAGDWVRDALLWKAPKAGNCPEEEEIESVFSPVASHSFG